MKCISSLSLIKLLYEKTSNFLQYVITRRKITHFLFCHSHSVLEIFSSTALCQTRLYLQGFAFSDYKYSMWELKVTPIYLVLGRSSGSKETKNHKAAIQCQPYFVILLLFHQTGHVGRWSAGIL